MFTFKDKRLEVVSVQIKWNCASYKVKGDMFYHRNRYNGTILTFKSWFLWFSSMKFLHKLSNYRGRYSWVTSHLFYVIVLHIVKWPIRTFHWSIAVTWHVWQLWFSPKIPSSIQHLQYKIYPMVNLNNCCPSPIFTISIGRLVQQLANETYSWH